MLGFRSHNVCEDSRAGKRRDKTTQERSLQFGEESKMESMAFAAGNKGLFILPDAVPDPPPLQILP